MKKLLLVTGALLMATTHSTFAAEANQNASTQISPKHPMTFAQLDTNSDSFLTKEEVRGRLLASFDKLDSDSNGKLSADEFNARAKGHKGDHKKRPTFEQLDVNSDGMLAKDEVRGRLLADFDQLDSDSNGTLSADEFNARVGMGKHDKKGNRDNRPTFEQLDVNSDGMLAKDEVRGRLLAHFAQVDSDSNGTLSADEFNARVGMGKHGKNGNRDNRPTFEQLDANADGMLSAEEFNAVAKNNPKMAN